MIFRSDCSGQLIINEIKGYLIDVEEIQNFVLAFFSVVAINQIYPPIMVQR